jgi:cellulose synthase/poly-beta-1,6-N-acetylglucosamine synthase-like glycosyltransferase
MAWLAGLFWLGLGLVVYAYLGYALVAALLGLFLSRPHRMAPLTPRVTLLIAAYDEEVVMEAKLENSLALDYPCELLDVLVVTDGSSDATPAIAESFRARGVRVEHLPDRRGKAHALNRVLPHCRGEVIVCSDANSFLNPEALRLMVRHFADPQVAGVAGEKRIMGRDGEVSAGEGLYWRYESLLKRLDSRLGSVMGAAGELVAIRRSHFHPLEPDTLIEDFVLSMRLVQEGHRVIYEPLAVAREAASFTLQDEFKRKTRIVAGGWQAIVRLRGLWWPVRPLVTFQYVSHRVLRWAVVPPLLPILFGLNVVLAWLEPGWYRGLLLAQIAGYAMAVLGCWWPRALRRSPCYWAFYFVFLNVAALVGAVRYWRGRQPVTWEKARRTRSA